LLTVAVAPPPLLVESDHNGSSRTEVAGRSRILSATLDEVVEHRPDWCSCSSAVLMADLPEVAPRVTQHRRLAVRCAACGMRVVAPMPDAAKGTPFGPRIHAVATDLKTFQTLSYARLQSTFAELFVLTVSQGDLMNMLRRAEGTFLAERDRAVAVLRQAKVIASNETGVRIEGCNAYHWVFRCSEAVVHHASPTRGSIVIQTLMDGHQPEFWCSYRNRTMKTCTRPAWPI
jgi:transposase